MSTRAWFGLKTSKGVLGTYLHSDGYPSEFGKKLYDFLCMGHAQTLIDLLVIGDGWSQLSNWDGNPDNLIGYVEYAEKVLTPYSKTRNESLFNRSYGVYYDGMRGDPTLQPTRHYWRDLGEFPYTYAIDIESCSLDIYCKKYHAATVNYPNFTQLFPHNKQDVFQDTFWLELDSARGITIVMSGDKKVSSINR